MWPRPSDDSEGAGLHQVKQAVLAETSSGDFGLLCFGTEGGLYEVSDLFLSFHFVRVGFQFLYVGESG